MSSASGDFAGRQTPTGGTLPAGVPGRSMPPGAGASPSGPDRTGRVPAAGDAGPEGTTRWRSRALTVVVPLATARALWGQAWRVDHRWDAARGWHAATVLLCAEPAGADGCTPVGWCHFRWRQGATEAVLDRIAWDACAGLREADAWSALELLIGQPLPR